MILKMNRSLKKMGVDKGGLGHADPEMRGGGGQSPENFFSALRVSIWPTNKGGRTPSLYPPLNDSQASRPAREPLGERAKT